MKSNPSDLRCTLSTFTALILATGLTFQTPAVYAKGADDVHDNAAVSTKDLVPVQRPIADLRPPPEEQEIAEPSTQTTRPSKPHRRGLHVTAWVNHKDNTYAIGDNVLLYVKANRNAYLTILDVGTSGKTYVIFPNRYQTDNHIRAGQIVKIPGSRADFDLQVQGPPGTELIKVIASTKPGVLFKDSDVEPAGPYKKLKSLAPEVAKDLQVVLRQNHRGAWKAYNKVIRIVEPW